MNKTQLSYFKDEDIIHLVISKDNEAASVELSPNITAELNEKGDLIGIEILNASQYLRDSILDVAQVKLLDIKEKSMV